MKSMLAAITILVLPVFAFTAEAQASQNVNYEIVDATSNSGYRIAMDSAGKFTYIDEEGNLLTEFIFDSCLPFHVNGYAVAYNTDAAGNIVESFSIDTRGSMEKFDSALGSVDYFDGEFGIVSLPSGNPQNPKTSALINSEKKLITDYNNEGMEYSNGIIYIHRGGKTGVIDARGNIIIPIEYDYISYSYMDLNDYKVLKPVTDNIFRVGKIQGSEVKEGYIRTNGQVLIPCEYDSAAEYQNRFGRLERGGKWAVVDTNVSMVTDFIYDDLYPYIEGLAVVRIGETFGCIDTSGNMATPNIYKEIGTRFIEHGNITAYLEEGVPIVLRNPLIEQRGINIYIDGEWLFTDTEPVIESSRTLAPLRGISEALGYDVEWNPQKQEVTLQNEEQIIHLTIGSNVVVRNIFDDGIAPETISLDVSARIIDGRTMVPVRFLAENIGAEVIWQGETRTILVKTN